MGRGAKGDVATLNHEAGDKTVKWGAIVCAACTKCEEILSCYRNSFAKDLDFKVAMRGVELEENL